MNELQIQPTTPIPALSQSKFEDMACGIMYTAKHVEGIQEPQNEFSLRGTQVHEAVSDYIRYLVRIRKSADAAWFDLNILVRNYLPDAMEILRDMRNWFFIDPEKVLDTELYLALGASFEPLETVSRSDFFKAHGYYPDYEGTLDLVQILDDGRAETVDWKTYFQIVAADTFQSKLYPLLVFKHYPDIQSVRFVLQFARYGAHAQREVVYTRADLPKLETAVHDARLRQIELHMEIGAHPEPMPGSHCAYCPKLRSCPLGESNRMTEEPADVLRRALWAQELLAQDTAILKAHAALGPLSVCDDNGKKFSAGFGERESKSYPLSVVSIVEANDPELAMKLTVSGLSTPLNTKKREGLRKLLEPLAEVSVTTAFKIGAEKEGK